MDATPLVARTVPDVREVLFRHRRAGRSIGLVPTMGALHAGHLALVRTARDDTDVVVVSIFVNPMQFGPGEDLDAYPRTFDDDLAKLSAEGVDVVFHPDATAYTPEDAVTTVRVAGLTEGLEATTRPTHFDGVTTIVAKLFNTIRPDRAYFGEKDFQQQTVIRRMAADLDTGVQVVTVPVVREPDGLAMSSRNVYLSPRQRRDAVALSAALTTVRSEWDGHADSARVVLTGTLEDAPGVRLDYAEIIDPETLEPLEGFHDGPAQAVVAAHVGTTRLIDTAPLPPLST